MNQTDKPAQIENRQQLIEYLESGCKPKSEWALGTEHEKFGFTTDDLRPLPYEGKRSIKAVLQGLADQFDWNPVEEQGNIIALLDGKGASVTLEPGGQLELSGGLLDNVHQTCQEVYTHLKQVKTISNPWVLHSLVWAFSPSGKEKTRSGCPKDVIASCANTWINVAPLVRT